MANPFFQCKEFIVHQQHTSMKVCTDACLFGAWVAKQPSIETAHSILDIGTGTGVLAAVLANRGITKIIATDNSHRALDCALKNINLLGLKANVTLLEANLYPKDKAGIDSYGKADLIICNPPWLPAHPSSALESAIYDEKSQMLKGFLNGLAEHLSAHGEGWLILSDFAEHLGLRTRNELLGWIAAAGLKVVDRADTKARHSKTLDASDPLHLARKAEVTSLWRLAKLD